MTKSSNSANFELSSLRAGDSQAWKIVHEHVQRAAARFRPALDEEWEDAVQEAEIKVLRELRSKHIPDASRFVGLVGRIVHSTCVDQYRRRQFRNRISQNDLVEFPGSLSVAPGAALEHFEALNRTQHILSLLSGECRQLLWMVIQGHNYSELASVFGVSPGALRVRAHRCRQGALKRWHRMTTPVVQIGFELFKTRGIEHTPLDLVAENAEEDTELVRMLFGEREAILWAAAERIVTGSGSLKYCENDSMRATAAAPDPASRIALAIELTSRRFERGIEDVHAIVNRAAQPGSRFQGLRQQAGAQRRGMAKVLVQNVLGNMKLKNGVTIDSLVSQTMNIDSTSNYRRLREKQGLSAAEIKAWMRRRMRRTIRSAVERA